MKNEITRESILKAVQDGSQSLSQIAIAHGYPKPVSGGVTAKIRKIVPEIADRLAGTYVEPTVATVAVAKVAKVKVAKVKKVKALVDPTVLTTQRKSPYGGKLYGAVFAEAIAAGKTEFRPFVEVTARKLNLTEQQVFVAANVMRIPKHQSNGNRSQDIAAERGVMHLVAIEAISVPAVPAVESVAIAETASETASETVVEVAEVVAEAVAAE